MEVSGGYEWEHILHIFHVLVSLLSRVEEAESEIERGKTLSGLVSYSCDMKNTIKWFSMQLIVLQRQ